MVIWHDIGSVHPLEWYIPESKKPIFMPNYLSLMNTCWNSVLQLFIVFFKNMVTHITLFMVRTIKKGWGEPLLVEQRFPELLHLVDKMNYFQTSSIFPSQNLFIFQHTISIRYKYLKHLSWICSFYSLIYLYVSI